MLGMMRIAFLIPLHRVQFSGHQSSRKTVSGRVATCAKSSTRLTIRGETTHDANGLLLGPGGIRISLQT